MENTELTGCTHNFSYLVKKYTDGGFTARVMEIPSIIVSSKTQEKLEPEIKETTLDYLKMFEAEHMKAKDGLLQPILISPQIGIVIGVKPFKITC